MAQYNADLILECTGKFNNKELSSIHMKQGAKVIVSAPCKDADKTVVFGVNHNILSSNDKIISISSCTQIVAPIAKILDDNLGIKSGFMTTIHSYANDQRIIDGGHKDLRSRCSIINDSHINRSC